MTRPTTNPDATDPARVADDVGVSVEYVRRTVIDAQHIVHGPGDARTEGDALMY